MDTLQKILFFVLFANNLNFIKSQEGLPVCDPAVVSWHPHPTSCLRFFICYHGNPLERTCAPGLHFSRTNLLCMHPQLAKCDFSHECPEVDDPFDPVMIPDPTDCTRFFVCFQREAIPRVCADGLWWDVEFKWCTVADNVNCDSRTPNNPNPGTTTTTVPTTTPTTTTTRTTTTRMITRYDCPLVSGTSFHPHPTNCQFFFECINGVSFLRQCPRGEHFDIVTRACQDESTAQCVLGYSESPFDYFTQSGDIFDD